MNVIDKLYFLPGALLLSLTLSAQTTNTTCTTYNYGPNGQINCTSTTQPSAYQEGQAAGQAGANLGGAIGLMIARHNQVKNYCKFHPGESWHSEDYSRAGVCKLPKQKGH